MQPEESNFNPLPGQQPPVMENTQTTSNNQGTHKLSALGKRHFKYIEFDPNEILMAEVRKHSFGLFVIIFTGIFISLTIFIAVVALVSTGVLDSVGFGNLRAIAVFAGFLLSVLVLLITLVNVHIYRNNVIFVTNEKLAQVLFITLFNRKISQLGIGDVQDVTVSQSGILPNLLGYGTLVVETAGEQQNYTFTYIPEPHETSKAIITAHEENMRKYGN